MTKPFFVDHTAGDSAASDTPSAAVSRHERGMVWFIGAGPGDPELVTVKGRRLIREADLVVYAGSLVPAALVAEAGHDTPQGRAGVVDSAALTLQETHALCRTCAAAGGLVARVHTGDPSLYGAVREQMALLRQDGIEYAVVPGVTAACAAAAAARVSLTVPEAGQSVVFTRLPGRTTVPERERLSGFAAHGCTLAVYLSVEHVEALRAELAELDPATPIVCAYRVGWPEERIVRATVGTVVETVRREGFDRQTLFLILPGEHPDVPGGPDAPVSRLYAPEFAHRCRS